MIESFPAAGISVFVATGGIFTTSGINSEETVPRTSTETLFESEVVFCNRFVDCFKRKIHISRAGWQCQFTWAGWQWQFTWV